VTVRALVTGGSRSGKSSFAESLVQGLGGERVLYVATAETLQGDPEMERRIQEHRRNRPATWDTFEVSYSKPGLSLTEALQTAGSEGYGGSGGAGAVLLDSLTLWISGVMSARSDEEVLAELEESLYAASRIAAPLVIVTDEVGLGLVPESPEGRRFRDLLGLANQRAATFAEEVHLCVSGVPLRLR
jgi:adenosyl cobinamide kinase/adenosyl cobinamide phosphate guanylyltransferase